MKELEDKIKNADKFKYIIVGDNPGKDEYKGKNDRQGYFIGKTSCIRNFMNKWAKENEIFYFNISPFYTENTKKLYSSSFFSIVANSPVIIDLMKSSSVVKLKIAALAVATAKLASSKL